MKQLETKGIVLRRLNYGEADRIITFLTSDFGKIRVMAKGVRKQKSKLAGGIELFSVSELHFIKGKGDIDTLVSSRLISNYGNIVKDLERTSLAYDALKLTDKIVEDTAGNEYFPLLHETLAALDDKRIPVTVAELSFLMRLLQILGHVPDFSTDNFGNPLNENDRFEFDYEAVSFTPIPDGVFDKNHLKALKLLAFNSPQAISKVGGIGRLAEDLAGLVRSLKNQYVAI